MPVKSGKMVQIFVQNYAQKTCKLIVQNTQTVERFMQKMIFTQAEVSFKQIFAIFYHMIHTLFNNTFYPLITSFTLFTHRTINTTITFNNKEINF